MSIVMLYGIHRLITEPEFFGGIVGQLVSGTMFVLGFGWGIIASARIALGED